MQAVSLARVLRILLVEDSPSDVRLLKEALRETQTEYELAVKADGQAALDYLLGTEAQTTRPDLILLNLNLPRKSGHEVLEELKKNAATRQIPVIVLSSSNASQDVGRAYELYANCYIQKPTDLEQFFRIIKLIEDFWLRMVELPAQDAPETDPACALTEGPALRFSS